jgi:hypothetical protein
MTATSEHERENNTDSPPAIIGVPGQRWRRAAEEQQRGIRYYHWLRAQGSSRHAAALRVERWRRRQQQEDLPPG